MDFEITSMELRDAKIPRTNLCDQPLLNVLESWFINYQEEKDYQEWAMCWQHSHMGPKELKTAWNRRKQY